MKPELKVGLAVSVAALVLWLVISWAKDVRVGQQTVNILFPNVSGLQIGDPVTVRGMKAGKVESIQILQTGVNVRVSLLPDIKLYRNATAKLTMLELMTGKKIELSTGTSDAGELQSGDIIQGAFAADVPTLVGYAGEAADTLRYLIADLQLVLRNANAVIGDPDLREDLKISVRNLRVITEDLKAISRDLRQTDIKSLVAKIDQTLTTIDALVKDLQPQLNGAVQDVRKTVKNADDLIASLKQLSDRLQQDRNSLVGKVLNDEKFVAKLDSVIAHLNNVLKLGEKEGINVKLRVF
ncbi:MAG: MlaD family protein [Chloroherpetonaceae bacterium]|nr:MlaD family protein [Chloroherpetonaceae bacterium]